MLPDARLETVINADANAQILERNGYRNEVIETDEPATAEVEPEEAVA